VRRDAPKFCIPHPKPCSASALPILSVPTRGASCGAEPAPRPRQSPGGSAERGAEGFSPVSISFHPRFCRNWGKRWKPKTSSSSKAPTTSSCSRSRRGAGKGGDGDTPTPALGPAASQGPSVPAGSWQSPRAPRTSLTPSPRCFAERRKQTLQRPEGFPGRGERCGPSVPVNHRGEPRGHRGGAGRGLGIAVVAHPG